MHFSSGINRPPYETADGYLQTTEGCSHNTCLFCTYFKPILQDDPLFSTVLLHFDSFLSFHTENVIDPFGPNHTEPSSPRSSPTQPNPNANMPYNALEALRPEVYHRITK